MQQNKANIMRKNPFDDEWVMYAPGRANIQSVSDQDVAGSPAVVAVERPCPFCPGAEEVGDKYDICILPNKFPSFYSVNSLFNHEEMMQRTQDGYGYQDVFVFNDDHCKKLVDQTPERIAKLLKTIGQRVIEHYQDSKIESVAAFENSGPEFGPSIKHPHGQLFALSFIPKRMHPDGESCAICERLVYHAYDATIIEEREHAVLVCPPYARFPYEMHVFPKKHTASLSDLDKSMLMDISELVKLSLQKLAAIKGGTMTYMFLIYVAPKRYLHDYHLRIEILPINKPSGGRKYLGGLELGFGVYVNPSIPEEIAKELRMLRVLKGEEQ